MNNSLRNYSYIVKSKGLGICIDPFDPELISQYLEKEQIELVSILNTHEHWDHLCGNEKLSELTGAQVRGILSFSIISSLLDLPWSYYYQFIIEEKFGFNKMNPSLFILDTVKQIPKNLRSPS